MVCLTDRTLLGFPLGRRTAGSGPETVRLTRRVRCEDPPGEACLLYGGWSVIEFFLVVVFVNHGMTRLGRGGWMRGTKNGGPDGGVEGKQTMSAACCRI